ncbi:MAG: hypothetical protein ACRD7E_32145 [Bryobacteraceae bacterium]
MLIELIATTRKSCAEALESAELKRAARELERAGTARNSWLSLVEHYWKNRRFPEDVAPRLQSTEGDFAAQRLLLLQACMRSLEKLPDARLAPSVKTMMCEEYAFLGKPEKNWLHLLKPASPTFRAFVGLSLLARFPCGQLDWEVSGIPRSWLLKVPRLDLPKILNQLVLRGSGFSPYFVPHTGVRRRPFILLEAEEKRAFFRMAQSMELQPEIKGIVRSSWLACGENHRISPHLAWIPKLIVENGGMESNIGASPEDAGFLIGSPVRKKLYESGEWKPKEGLLIWPRDAVLAWAARHPELSDSAGGL